MKVIQTSETLQLIKKCLEVLPKLDSIKYLAVVMIQIFLGFLDLLGIFMLGLLGSLAIRGLSYQDPGNRVSTILEFFRISDDNLRTQITVIGLVATIFLVAKSFLSLYLGKQTLFFLSRRSAILSSSLVSKLFSRDITLVQKDSIASRIYTLTTGVENVTTGILGAVALLLADFSLLTILSFGLFVVDPTLAIISLIYFSSLGFILYLKMHLKYKKLGEEVTLLTVEGNEKISEIVTSYREILIRNRRQFYAKIIGEKRLKTSNANAEIGFMGSFSKYAMELFVVFGGLGIAAFEFITQPPSRAIAIISIFLATSSRIAPGILRIQQAILSIKNKTGTALTTLELIDELSLLDEITEDRSKLDFEHEGFDGSLKIRKLRYQYPGSKNFNLDIDNLDIAPGSFVAIVGPSGVGKTTFVDLILGVLTPTDGTILISNEPPKEVINNWPGVLGYVPQNISINQGTIKSNICLGYAPLEIEDYRVWDAIMKAELLDFVRSLSDGLESKVDDRGSNLSGGQRQRLGIARALFTNPKFVVLDEATSALDAETEKNITKSIKSLHGRATVLVIAHRLSTVTEADEVLYFEKGRIVARGKFEDVRSKVVDFDRQAKLMGL